MGEQESRDFWPISRKSAKDDAFFLPLIHRETLSLGRGKRRTVREIFPLFVSLLTHSSTCFNCMNKIRTYLTPVYLPLAFLLLFLVGGVNDSRATHVMGADLTYTCLGGNQYEITLTMYRDCDGVATALPAYNVDIFSASCGQTATLTLNQTSVTDISPICPALIGNSSCNGGPLSGVEQYVYSGTYTFPAQCSDWVISWAECCRNGAITNANVVPIANGTETYIAATLDNLTVSCNSSPTFTNIPTPYVCAGEPFQYNHGAFDPDGDSIAYELITPLELTLGNPTPVTFLPPFTATYPISTLPANNFGFDPLTGQLDFTPDAPQRGITAILVKQYRNGNLIGTTMRDLQIVVQTCTNNLPAWNAPTAVAGGTLNGQVFTVCAGNTLSFSVGANDNNAGDALGILSNLAQTIPGATLTTAGTNPATATFTWNTTAADVGVHPFTLTVTDDACPIFGRQTIGFEIYVVGPVEVTASNQTVCPGTNELIQLNAVVPGSPGNATFAWTPAAGLSNPNIANPQASVSEAITYTVTATEGVCTSNASIDILAVGNLDVTPDTALCAPGAVQLNSNFLLNLPPPPAVCGPSANACGGPATAATVGSAATSTGTLANAGGAGSPFLGFWEDGRTQMLFRANELNAAGVTPGIISELSIDVQSLFSTAAYNGFTIRMGCTGATELNGFEGGLTQVFTGNYTPVAGANDFVLATPYEWDGSSNLVVEFCFDNAVASGYDHVSYTNTSYASVYFAFANGAAGCNLTAGFPTTQRPNITFTSCPLAVTPVYTWTPAAGLSSTTATNPVANVTGSTDYVLTVATPGCDFTDTASISLAGPPTLNPFADLQLCVGDSVQIVPTGTNLANATSYVWTPAAGLSDPNVLSPRAAPAANTTYTLTVTNACGSASGTVNVIVAPSPTVTLTPTSISCAGAGDGSITANPAGGTPGYTYSWNPAVGITQTVNNLGPGTYGLTLTDASNCTATASVTLADPPLLNATITASTDPTCFGANDGTIDALGTGGTGPYEYSLDGVNFQASGSFTGLGGGTYTVTVRDANLCLATIQIVLNDPLEINGLITGSTDSDCLIPTGSVTLTGDGGAGGYTYSIDGTNFQPGGNFTGLAPGIYTVTIQDQNGCSGTVTVTISATSAPTATLTGLTNVTCPGGNDGSMFISATGGVAPYTYSIDGVNFQNNGNFTGLSAGTYVVTINDANGCPDFLNVTVTEPPALTGFISSQADVTCNGGADGAVQIFGNGGTPGYTYSIDGVTFNATSLFNNLAAGNYTITIRDANLCETTVPVTIAEPAPLTATVIALTPVDCNGNNTGAITVTGNGGNGGYEYSLDGVNFQAAGAFGGLAAGNYTVTIRDLTNCTGTTTVTIPEPNALTGTVANNVSVSCFGGADGAVTLAGQGGTGPYTFSDDGITFSPNATFTGLAAGPYVFEVQDANGCLATVNATVTQPAQLNAGLNQLLDASCNGLADGSATLSGTGGTAPYEYSLDGGVTFQPAATFTGLGAGTYNGVVRDDNGCLATINVTIAQPAPVTGNLVSVTDVTCFGANDGTIIVNGVGGNGGPYTYSTDGVTFQAATAFNGLLAGPYTITIRDANNCEGTVNATIAEPPQLGITITQFTGVTCPGGSDGQIDFFGIGGTVNTPADYEYSLNNGPFQPTGNFPNVPAGTYTMTVRDLNGCVFSQTLPITEPPALGLAVNNQTDVTCFGGNDGAVDLTGSGGTPGYQFSTDGVNFQAGGVFTGLTAGTFTLTIQDANGCIGTDSVTINQPPQLNLVVNNQVNVACFGDSSGAITVSGSGGTPGYQFGLVGFPLTPINSYSGIPAGAYPLVVSDANGCTDTNTVVITQPAPIGLVLDSTQNVLCNGGNSGILYLNVTGGTAPFSYSANNGPAQGSPNLGGLTAGTYSVVVTDAGGCQDSLTATVTEPPALQLTAGPGNDVTCPGGNDGTASVVASGGRGPYSYFWIPTGDQTDNVTNLSAGSYQVDVTDVNGCTASLPVTINEPDSIQGNITLTQGISCFGQSDAAAVANASGGTPGYTYAWSQGIATGNSVGTLPAGMTYLTITDALGCQATDSIEVVPPPAIGLTMDSTNISCFGLTDGSVTANASGGAGGFTYLWNNDPALNTATLSNQGVGTYTVLVTDANGCQAFDTVQVTQPPAITTVAGGQNETCTDANGVLFATATGGAGGFTYVWNTTPVQSGDTILNVPAGSYAVVVADANGCLDSASVTIIDEAAPTLAVDTILSTSCFGVNDGGATVVATGGTGTYTYTWNSTPVQTGPVLTNVAAGSYLVTVDDGQCQTGLTVAVPEPQALDVQIATIDNPTCDATSDGSVTSVVTGGTPGYSFTWNTVPAQTDSIATGLAEGSYQLLVVDANGCQDTLTATLIAPEALTITLQGDSVNCFGETTGEAVVFVDGGTRPYNFAWTGTSATGDTARNLGVGTYSVQVTDANGCTIGGEVAVGGPEPLVLDVTGTDLICFEGNDGTAAAVVSGGTGPYTYSWTSGDTSPQPTGLAAGTWTVTVLDARGCDIEGSVTLLQPEPIAVSLQSFEGAFCDLPNGTATVTATGGTPGYAFTWNTDPAQQGPTATTLFGGSAGQAPVVTVSDANGCTISDTVLIPNDPPAVADFTAENLDLNQEILLSQGNIRFVNQSQFAISYQWDFGDGTFTEAESPVHRFNEEGDYRVILTAWDENFACPDTASLLIRIVPDGSIYVPNAFTPNGDGSNDVFYFFGMGIVEMEATIFDRWGRPIIVLNDISQGWNGRLPDGSQAQEGVYVYRLTGRLNNGADIARGGTITLLR